MNYHKFNCRGREVTLRQKTDTSNWSIREKIDGKLRATTFPTRIKADAERYARDYIRKKAEGEGETVRELLRQRKAVKSSAQSPSLGIIIDAYRAAPQGPLERTRRENIICLRSIINKVLGPEPLWTERSVLALTKDLVRGYKHLVLDRARQAGASQAETARHQRTANSTLRQARSVFSEEMLEHYQVNCGLTLELIPLNEFRTTPGFLGLRKTTYNQPDDSQMAAMIQALEQIRESQPDIYLLCWLGLTFGLRKSEVAPLTTDCFIRLDGEIYVEIRTVEGRGALRDQTKNGQEIPRVKATNGGGSKIGAIIEAMPRGRYVSGGTDTDRTDRVFRRVNAWLASQGWKTQKKFRELRAFAGSRVIMNDGIEAASQWLRHGSISTTQAHYGRYARNIVRDIPLSFSTPRSGAEPNPPQALATPLAAPRFEPRDTPDTPVATPNWVSDRDIKSYGNWHLKALNGENAPVQIDSDKGFTRYKPLI